MLMPSLFNDDYDLFGSSLLDPWFDNRGFEDMEKKLYGHRAKNVMNTDVRESDTGYEMEIDLPGFSKDEITVELTNGYLTISAAKGFDKDEAESEEEAKHGRYIRRERYAGSCQRSYYVGEQYRQEDIKAKFEHGILTLSIPKKSAQELESRNYIAIEG